MGVDYRAHYGIGFQIMEPKEEQYSDEEFDDFQHWFSEKIKPELEKKYEIFEVGDGYYTGEDNEMYVVLKEPLKEGFYNASIKAAELKEDLLKYDLIDGDKHADVVGGMLEY